MVSSSVNILDITYSGKKNLDGDAFPSSFHFRLGSFLWNFITLVICFGRFLLPCARTYGQRAQVWCFSRLQIHAGLWFNASTRKDFHERRRCCLVFGWYSLFCFTAYKLRLFTHANVLLSNITPHLCNVVHFSSRNFPLASFLALVFLDILSFLSLWSWCLPLAFQMIPHS